MSTNASAAGFCGSHPSAKCAEGWGSRRFDFLWNNRQMNDGERTIAVIRAAEGKRLRYKDPIAERAYIRNRGQGKADQLEPF